MNGCTHDCEQGDLCTCDTDHGALWIRIPDAIIVLLAAVAIGVVIGVQLVKAGMTL